MIVCEGRLEGGARLIGLGSKAAQAVAEELRGEKAVLERRIADGDLERKRLTEQVDELRDQLHRAQVRCAKLAEHTSALHALAVEEG